MIVSVPAFGPEVEIMYINAQRVTQFPNRWLPTVSSCPGNKL